MSEYRTTVGIEVHAELKTKTKMFSNSINHYGTSSNTNMNLIDFGYPGTLPQVNRYGIELGIRAALVLNCQINKHMHFDRKNYFYPDLPKGYQITQARTPIGVHGFVEIEEGQDIKKIGIHDIHLEEDTCKSVHTKESALLDFNRAGVPLLEIVSDPDIHSSKEAMLYLEKLRELLLYSDVSDVKIEEGSMRCDVNVSVSKTDKLGVRAEIKNVSSIAAVGMAIESETKRQIALLESGGVQEEETRRYDEGKDETILMRKKETGNDYRYFPEPDIPYVNVTDEEIEEVRKHLPVSADVRRKEYIRRGISPLNADKIIQNRAISDFLLEASADANLVTISNLLLGDISGYLNAKHIELKDISLSMKRLEELANKFDKKEISSKIVKEILEDVITTEEDLNQIIERHGGASITDTDALLAVIRVVLENNPQSVNDYRAGHDRAMKFLMGQVMKETKGKANPVLVQELLLKQLAE